MSHVRQQIRDEVAALIRSQVGLADKVSVSRVFPVQKSDGINVYTSNEEAANDLITPPGSPIPDSNRFCIVTVEIHAMGQPEKFDEALDSFAILVELALFDDGLKLAMCKGWEYRGMNTEYSGDGDMAGGVMTMEYAFQYRVSGFDPETAE